VSFAPGSILRAPAIEKQGYERAHKARFGKTPVKRKIERPSHLNYWRADDTSGWLTFANRLDRLAVMAESGGWRENVSQEATNIAEDFRRIHKRGAANGK
jgi:hypothetical protein